MSECSLIIDEYNPEMVMYNARDIRSGMLRLHTATPVLTESTYFRICALLVFCSFTLTTRLQATGVSFTTSKKKKQKKNKNKKKRSCS